MIQYRTYIKADETGGIVGKYICAAEEGECPNPQYKIEISHKDSEMLALHGTPNCLWDVQRRVVKAKPTVLLIVDKYEIKSDGKDEAHLTFEHLPAGIGSININVAGIEDMVDPKQKIIITTEVAQNLYIQVKDKFVRSESIIVKGLRDNEK